MSQIPIQVFLVPVVGVIVLAFTLIQRRSTLKKYDTQYSNYRAGELAQRLNLRLLEGDPTFNLFIRQAHVDVARGPSDKKPLHVSVRMQGEPRGVSLELVYLYRVEQETNFNVVTWRTWFDCRMSARSRQPFPPFEVVSRTTPLGAIAQTRPLPPMPTGDPAVDALYSIHTQEPGVARLLAQVLGGFAAFSASGVHLVGDGQSVSFVMQQDRAPLAGSVLYYAETLGELLCDLARRLGG